VSPPVLAVPAAAWSATLEALARYKKGRVEGGCLWYGDSAGVEPRVSIVGVPTQINRPRNFEIPAGALEALNRSVPEGHVVMAQVHTHPGSGTKQSPWDDRMIVSRKIISVVLPRYGRPPCDLGDCGLHVYVDDRWRKLRPGEVNGHIRVVGGPQNAVAVIDLR
jgi:proteasome lid subunit RPN8/RPN11